MLQLHVLRNSVAELDRMWNKAFAPCFKVLSLRILRGTKRTAKNHNVNSQHESEDFRLQNRRAAYFNTILVVSYCFVKTESLFTNSNKGSVDNVRLEVGFF
jgi:hypothetical protein